MLARPSQEVLAIRDLYTSKDAFKRGRSSVRSPPRPIRPIFWDAELYFTGAQFFRRFPFQNRFNRSPWPEGLKKLMAHLVVFFRSVHSEESSFSALLTIGSFIEDKVIKLSSWWIMYCLLLLFTLLAFTTVLNATSIISRPWPICRCECVWGGRMRWVQAAEECAFKGQWFTIHSDVET